MKFNEQNTFRILELATKEEGAKVDLVLFNVKDDIAVDIRKSRKELFEAILQTSVIKQYLCKNES